jgi:septum formation protein
MITKEINVLGPFQAVRPLVLASGSPRRRDLIASLGVDFEVLPPEAEPEPATGESPADFAVRAALAKAREVAESRPEAVIVAADTVVVIENEILGKPDDADHAMLMLSRLAGNDHRVLTGCALLAPGGAEPVTFAVETSVTMAPQALETLMAYANCGEPLDKAGAYAIQGVGGFMVSSIRGSYSNVVGLPLAEVVEALTALRAIRPADTRE